MNPLTISLLRAALALVPAFLTTAPGTVCAQTPTAAISRLAPSPSETERESVRVVTDFLSSVQAGDAEGMRALLHPQVRWYQPGNHRLSGLKQSREEVFALSARIHERTARSYRITSVSTVGVNGETVAVQLHCSAAHPALVLEVDNIDVFTVKNGLITEVRVHSADPAHEDAFWGR